MGEKVENRKYELIGFGRNNQNRELRIKFRPLIQIKSFVIRMDPITQRNSWDIKIIGKQESKRVFTYRVENKIKLVNWRKIQFPKYVEIDELIFPPDINIYNITVQISEVKNLKSMFKLLHHLQIKDDLDLINYNGTYHSYIKSMTSYLFGILSYDNTSTKIDYAVIYIYIYIIKF